MVRDPNKTSFIGINSSSDYRKEHLCSTDLKYQNYEGQIEMIVDCLNQVGTKEEPEYVQYKQRSRIILEKNEYSPNQRVESRVSDSPKTQYLVLNEMLAAEKEPSQLSIYKLEVCGRNLGKFRSSGIIIATGTGSTGWLHSAKRITAKTVNNLKRIVGL